MVDMLQEIDVGFPVSRMLCTRRQSMLRARDILRGDARCERMLLHTCVSLRREQRKTARATTHTLEQRLLRAFAITLAQLSFLQQELRWPTAARSRGCRFVAAGASA